MLAIADASVEHSAGGTLGQGVAQRCLVFYWQDVKFDDYLLRTLCPDTNEIKGLDSECRLWNDFIGTPFLNYFGPVGNTWKRWSWGSKIVIKRFGHAADGGID